ncbi:hypothetical protein U4M03_27575, partial [Klebsiella pneumoniae]|nr:hypothetical protein [Klebsiella pneumoniae]
CTGLNSACYSVMMFFAVKRHGHVTHGVFPSMLFRKLTDWPFWQVYAILALAYFAGRFGLKKRASSKDEPQEGKTTGQ